MGVEGDYIPGSDTLSGEKKQELIDKIKNRIDLKVRSGHHYRMLEYDELLSVVENANEYMYLCTWLADNNVAIYRIHGSLSREEEVELFKELSLIPTEQRVSENAEYVDIRNRLYESNKNVIMYVASKKRMRNLGSISPEDIYQICALKMYDAINYYDYKKYWPTFASYASHFLFNNALSENYVQGGVPVYMKDIFNAVSNFRDAYFEENAHDPSPKEISDALEMDEESIIDVIKAEKKLEDNVSIDELQSQVGEESFLGGTGGYAKSEFLFPEEDLIDDSGMPIDTEPLHPVDAQNLIIDIDPTADIATSLTIRNTIKERLLPRLSDKRAKILELIIGLETGIPMTPTEAAKKIGMKPSTVTAHYNQIVRAIAENSDYTKLRKTLKDYDDDPNFRMQ